VLRKVILCYERHCKNITLPSQSQCNYDSDSLYYTRRKRRRSHRPRRTNHRYAGHTACHCHGRHSY
jgi:hypothetical protein